MKWIAIILFSIPSLLLQAQKCSYRVNSVSGMDGTRLVITEPIELAKDFDNAVLQAWTTIYGDTALVLAFVIITPDNIQLLKGDKVSLYTSGEDIVDLEIFQEPVKTTSTPKKLTCLTVVNNENIMILERALVTKILFTGEKYQKEGILEKKKSKESIGKLIGCVKEYLQ